MLASIRGLAVALSIALLGSAGCATSKPETTTAPGTDLAAYRSFRLLSASDNPPSAEQPLSILDANIQNAIRTQLAEKGYSEVKDGADLGITYETEAYVREETTSPVRIGVGMGSWGSNVGGGVGASVPVGREDVVATQETRLTIRAVDPQSNREVWVGSTTGAMGVDAGTVEKAVAGMLADFPTRRR